MTTQQERRAATLKEIHSSIYRDTSWGLADAAVAMGIRYGAACTIQARNDLDLDLTTRARDRRFAAFLRLMNALRRQS